MATGNRDTSIHVVKKGEVVISFESLNKPEATSPVTAFISKHGDTIRDIAFGVDDVELIYDNAVRRGAVPISAPRVVEDEHGYVKLASLHAFEDVVHTLVERKHYKGRFLPGFKPHYLQEPLNPLFPSVQLLKIDHVGIPVPVKKMKPICSNYFKTLDFHHFWSVDEKVMASKESALRTTVISDFDEKVKMPVFEPAPGQKVSQIQEFLEHNGGGGAQHVAVLTEDIIKTVSTLRVACNDSETRRAVLASAGSVLQDPEGKDGPVQVPHQRRPRAAAG